MKEVEILVKVFDDKEKVLSKLSKFNYIGKQETQDIYFYHTKNNNFQIKNHQFPKQWFRVRKKENKAFLTFKKDYFKKDKWFYSDENEVEINDFNNAIKIIKNLGFKQLIKISNIKHIFKTELYEIVFEEVKDLGFFLEVERLNVSENDNLHKIRSKIQDFINNLKLNLSKELNFGKPELMLRKKNQLNLFLIKSFIFLIFEFNHLLFLLE